MAALRNYYNHLRLPKPLTQGQNHATSAPELYVHSETHRQSAGRGGDFAQNRPGSARSVPRNGKSPVRNRCQLLRHRRQQCGPQISRLRPAPGLPKFYGRRGTGPRLRPDAQQPEPGLLPNRRNASSHQPPCPSHRGQRKPRYRLRQPWPGPTGTGRIPSRLPRPQKRDRHRPQ